MWRDSQNFLHHALDISPYDQEMVSIIDDSFAKRIQLECILKEARFLLHWAYLNSYEWWPGNRFDQAHEQCAVCRDRLLLLVKRKNPSVPFAAFFLKRKQWKKVPVHHLRSSPEDRQPAILRIISWTPPVTWRDHIIYRCSDTGINGIRLRNTIDISVKF
jgi:hypothetical protein